MKAFLCECKKTKGKLMAVMLPTILFLLFWMLWNFSYMDEDETSFYYTYFTQGLLVMNTIFLPIMIAIMASRMMDMETKGSTYKLLCTLMPKTRIFTCKVALAALYLLGFFCPPDCRPLSGRHLVWRHRTLPCRQLSANGGDRLFDLPFALPTADLSVAAI